MDLLAFLIQEAMTKDGFVIYKSFYAPIQSLSDESLGKLFRAIFEYQIHGVCVELPVELTMAFNFFKTKFESDNIKYEAIVHRNKENGRKGGRPSKEDTNSENPKNPLGFLEPKKADKDKDKDKDKDEDKKNKEERDKSLSKKDGIDFDEIKAKWKEYNPNLEQPRMLNDKRKKAIRILLKNNNATIDDLYMAFKLISTSSFCQGRNKNNWKATFDWLINDTKGCFNRVLEGVYAYLPSEMEQVKKIKEGIDFSNGSNYAPIAGVDFFYNDFYKTWMYIGYDTSFIPDGYNKDNRPDGAKVTLNNARGVLVWNAKDKKWEKE
ncbi:MAG: DUF6291 domain-containing protein [Alphaproteobacteria bacterium]